jgi:DNA-binding protein HU-beta
MNLAELVDVVADRTGQTKTVSRDVVKIALDTILKEVKKGGRVSIVGFGAFYQAVRKSRVGRNPQTGDVVKISASRVPRFKAGKDFRESVKNVRTQKKLV